MSTQTPLGQFTLPVLDDASNVPAVVQVFVDQIEEQVLQFYDSDADRTTKNPTPVAGSLSYLRDGNTHWRYSSTDSAWVPLSQSGRLLGELQATQTTTLAVAPTTYLLPGSAIKLVLAAQRRLRVVTRAQLRLDSSGSAGGNYAMLAGYNPGAAVTTTPDTATGGATVIAGGNVPIAMPGDVGRITAAIEGSVLLTPGTYWFYAMAQRRLLGTALDTAANGYTAIYDAGSS